MNILTSLLFIENKRYFKLPSKPVDLFSSQITLIGHLIIWMDLANLFSIDPCFNVYLEISMCLIYYLRNKKRVVLKD